jgi:tetratricopeptide (TPR) repeat protein
MGALPGLLIAFVSRLSGDAPLDEGAFVKAFAELQQLGNAGQWSEEKAALQALLETTGDQPWVRSRRTELVDEMRRAAIRSAVPQPDPATLTDGKLLAWNPRSGEFSITYSQGHWKDFSVSGDFLVHAAAFDGPLTMRVSGDDFRWSGAKLLHLLIGAHGDETLEVVVGAGEEIGGGIGFKPICEFIQRAGARQTVLGNFEHGPSFGKSFDLEVAVTDRGISVGNGVSRYGEVKLPPDFHGRVGLTNSPAIKRLALRGRASPEWLQGRLDAVTRDAERKFLETWRVDDELPPWLRNGEPPAPAAAATQAGMKLKLPWLVTKTQETLFASLETDLDGGHADRVLERLAKLPPDALPRDVADYLRFDALLRLGALDREAGALDPFIARNPDFAAGLYFHARLQYERFALDDAARELAALHGRLPDPGVLASDRVQVELQRGRPEEAQRILREARAEGVTSPEFDDLDQTVVHLLRGPEFAKRSGLESPHFAVATDLGVAAARDALKVLEESYAICSKIFGESDAPARPFPVYLFASQAGYAAYVGKQSTRAHSTVGMYSKLFKHLMVWNQTENGETARTLRHEATHQYLDLLGYRVPVWLDEGLAVYVELIASGRKADVGGGAVDPVWLAMLTKHRSELRPVADFVATTPDAFYDRGEASYSQAWALVHFLRHGAAPAGAATSDDPAPQEVNSRLMAALRERVAPQDVFRRAFDGVDLAKFDGRFLDHVVHLRAPPTRH